MNVIGGSAIVVKRKREDETSVPVYRYIWHCDGSRIEHIQDSHGIRSIRSPFTKHLADVATTTPFWVFSLIFPLATTFSVGKTDLRGHHIVTRAEKMAMASFDADDTIPRLSLAGAPNAIPKFRKCDFQLLWEGPGGLACFDFQKVDVVSAVLLCATFDGFGMMYDRHHGSVVDECRMDPKDYQTLQQLMQENQVSYETTAPILIRFVTQYKEQIGEEALVPHGLLR
jgi:hypothetical protein